MALLLTFGSHCNTKKFLVIVIILACQNHPREVTGETEWVWSRNQVPHPSGSSNTPSFANNPNFGQTNFGVQGANSNNNLNNLFGPSSSLTGDRDGSSSNLFPDSPNPNGGNKEGVTTLPDGSIRVVNAQGEARLIPSIVTNALQNLGGSGNKGGLLNSGWIGTLLQTFPQIASSALGILLGRRPGNNVPSPGTGSGTNNANPLPAAPAPSFPSFNPGIGSVIGGGGGGTNSASGGACKCIPLNSCFLPSRPNGNCQGGNINCCQTSSSTRAISDEHNLNTRDIPDSPDLSNINSNSVGATSGGLTRAEVRLGLLQNILKQSGVIVDDALDFALHPYLTEEDQQKLATRIG